MLPDLAKYFCERPVKSCLDTDSLPGGNDYQINADLVLRTGGKVTTVVFIAIGSVIEAEQLAAPL